jgi:hypothetical protein
VADLTRCWPDLTRIAVEVEKLALYAPQLAPDARTTTIFALMGALGVFVAAVIVSCRRSSARRNGIAAVGLSGRTGFSDCSKFVMEQFVLRLAAA